jgi:hypothetical protein
MGPGPIMSAELSRLHQQDLLREAERDRLAVEATAGAPTALARAERGLLQLRNALLPACASGEKARMLPGVMAEMGQA